MTTINSVTVLGAGVLGSQISWHTAFKGKQVTVYDISEDALAHGQMAQQQYKSIYQTDLAADAASLAATEQRLRFTTDLADAVKDADLVIEAVPEVPEIKQSVYTAMAPLLPEHTLIATNSSTLLPRDFAEFTGRPEKYAAIHYANMIWSLNLAEVMGHPGTDESTLTQFVEFAIETGMVPIPVSKEQNGYVLNSWFVPLLNSAQSLITNGVCSPETLDKTFLIANRGCSFGPAAMLDIVGMKTVFDVLTYWGEVGKDQQMLANAEYVKTHFLDKGITGVLSGSGYYQYPNPSYAEPGFIDVPSAANVADIVKQIGC